MDNIEYYETGIHDITEQMKSRNLSKEEMEKATRNLVHFHIKLEKYEEAKELLRTYFHFGRKDLLMPIANLCTKTKDPAIAEELIGEIRCYAYTWLEFAVEMQRLYTELGEVEKAEALQHSLIEVAFMSLRPATRAMYKSLEISGHISDSLAVKQLYREIKRVHKEHA